MVATLAYRDILQKQTQSRTSIPKQSVLIPTDHRTGDSTGDFFKSGVTLGFRSPLLAYLDCFVCFTLGSIVWV